MKNHNGDLSLDILLKAMKLPTILEQYREVAEVLDCSIGTVKTQMFRALRTLADNLPELRE